MLATVKRIETIVSEYGVTTTILNTRRHWRFQRWSWNEGTAEKEDRTFWVLGQLVPGHMRAVSFPPPSADVCTPSVPAPIL